MDTEEINKYIHVEIMGKCWHEDREQPPDMPNRFWSPSCALCGEDPHWRNPDYCSDDSPRRLLNEVMRKVPVDGLSIYCLAEQIARACVDAHRESVGEKIGG